MKKRVLPQGRNQLDSSIMKTLEENLLDIQLNHFQEVLEGKEDHL